MNDIAVSVKIRRKRTVSILLALALLLSLAAGCAGGTEVARLPEKLHIEFDGSALDTPEAAPVITAKRVIFDKDAAASVLMQGAYEETVEGEGNVLRSEHDGVFEILTRRLDRAGKPVELRAPVGMLDYRSSTDGKTDLAARVGSVLGGGDPAGEWMWLKRFVGDEDFPDFSADEARTQVRNILRRLGVPDDLENTLTHRLSAEEQESELRDYLSIDEEPSLLSDAYILRYRQSFDGIPVNTIDWYRGIVKAPAGEAGDYAPWQFCYAVVSADGDLSLHLENIFEADSKTEAKAMISYDEALGKLGEVFGGTLLLTDKYLVDAELCYAIYETDTRDTFMLYPLWIFSLADCSFEDLEGMSNLERRHYYADIYTFDAFTGEQIITIAPPAVQ